MSASDLYAYRSCYCESCHQLRRNFGIISTAAVNYDMTFNGIILNSISPNGVKEQNMRNGMICIFGRALDSEVLKKVAGYTLLLTKWELEDDRNDDPNIRSSTASIVLGRAIRKAERTYPEYDEWVSKGFQALRRIEERGDDDAVRIGKEFASYLMPAMRDIAGSTWTKDLEDLFVNLGTFVYLMDAVDDLDEDYMKGTFNPFLSGCDDYRNKTEFIRNDLYRITDMMNTVMKDIRMSYSSVRDSMRFHHGIADNIILKGLPESAKRTISGECCDTKRSISNTMSSRMRRRGPIGNHQKFIFPRY